MAPLIFRNLLPNSAVPLTILGGPFRGAILHLNPRHSLRKVLGLYEYQLNKWLEQALPNVVTILDVGANDGYFTYGCAQGMKRHHIDAYIIAFEPAMDEQSALKFSATLPQYKGIHFEFLSLFVGSTSSSDKPVTTLNQIYSERPFLHGKPALIKVDVEGDELEVLKGATSLLNSPHHWVVEVHGDHLLDPVQGFFDSAERSIDIHPPKPHWLLGPESRSIKTSWITTKLD